MRVSFAGGGTDLPAFYERGYGAVLSTAIDKYIWVTVKRHSEVFDEPVRVNYSLTEQVDTVRVVEAIGGLTVVPGMRSDLLRAASWALGAAARPRKEPSIR